MVNVSHAMDFFNYKVLWCFNLLVVYDDSGAHWTPHVDLPGALLMEELYCQCMQPSGQGCVCWPTERDTHLDFIWTVGVWYTGLLCWALN